MTRRFAQGLAAGHDEGKQIGAEPLVKQGWASGGEENRGRHPSGHSSSSGLDLGPEESFFDVLGYTDGMGGGEHLRAVEGNEGDVEDRHDHPRWRAPRICPGSDAELLQENLSL
jgi:hypothetical protein